MNEMNTLRREITVGPCIQGAAFAGIGTGSTSLEHE